MRLNKMMNFFSEMAKLKETWESCYFIILLGSQEDIRLHLHNIPTHQLHGTVDYSVTRCQFLSVSTARLAY